MEIDSPLLRFTLLSALIGFGVFCAAQTAQVWRRGNRRAARKEAAPQPLADAVRGWSAALLVLGVLVAGFAVALREVTRAEGVLNGDGLFAVRARDDFELKDLREEGPVEQGAVLAHFHSPQVEAETEELRLRAARLRAEKETLQLQPGALDPELVRRHQDATLDARQLQSALYLLLPTSTGVVRDVLAASLTRQEQLAHLEVDLNSCRKELDQALVKRRHGQDLLTRDRALRQQNAISTQETEDHVRDLRFFEVEVERLRRRCADLEGERGRFHQGLAELAALAAEQSRVLSREVEET